VGLVDRCSFRAGDDSCSISDSSTPERRLGAWTSTLATIAFAVVIVDNYWPIVYTEARAALSVPGSPQWIDVQGWLAYGAVGLWLLVISLLALRSNIWTRGLAYLGVFVAFIYFLALASSVFPALVLSGAILFVAGIAVVIAPIFFTWMGLYLRPIGSA
jgi:hypothetical protein